MRITYFLIIFLLCLGTSSSKAQYTVLHYFNDTNGEAPVGSLALSGNKFYGMTVVGGKYSYGTIYSIDTNGAGYKVLLNFNDTNGAYPYGSLTLSGKVLYGMTYQGGSFNHGCVFSIDTNGNRYKDMLDFNGTNGSYPNGSLTLSGNILYGITSNGGTMRYGNVFSIDTNGTQYKDLFDFNNTNGAEPEGSLTLSGRMLFGTTNSGLGGAWYGTIFSVDTNGNRFRNLLYFNDTNGANPYGYLTLCGTTLYGIANGGIYNNSRIFSIDTSGNKFKDYSNDTNCISPQGSLTLSGYTLYGMTYAGGAYHYGDIFSIDTNGSGYRDLFDFNDTDGSYPDQCSLLLLGSILYGVATERGVGLYDGVIFRIDTSNTVTSINELTSSSGTLKVFPNPNNGKFHIEQSAEKESEVIEVYNMLGEKVYSQPLRQAQGGSQIDLSNNADGVYLFRIITETGDLISEGKVVIQK
jgi:uncharacterized repeat protein (TIGR03803 family)